MVCAVFFCKNSALAAVDTPLRDKKKYKTFFILS